MLPALYSSLKKVQSYKIIYQEEQAIYFAQKAAEALAEKEAEERAEAVAASASGSGSGASAAKKGKGKGGAAAPKNMLDDSKNDDVIF